MNLIVAGSRGVTDRGTVRRAIEDADLLYGPVDEIIHGGARGVDTIAADIASSMGFDVREMPADWDEHGKAAGPIRNQQMAKEGDALVAVWDGDSAGTYDMIEAALDAGLDVYVVQP